MTQCAIQPAAGVLDTTAETYEYDGASRLTKATDNDSTVIFGYDSLNRRTSETQNGKLIQYTYDKVNNLTSIRYPNQRIIDREFDVLNRIGKIKQGGTQIANMEFIGRTYRMLSKGYQNGDVVKYLYDQGWRMTSIDAKNLNQQIINQYAYGYNKVNLKNYEQRLHDASKGDVYAYDAINRIKNIKFDATDPTDPLTAQFAKAKTYNLDKVDNILKIVENKNSVDTEILTEMTASNAQLNQYTKFDQWTMAYDQNGNTTQKGSQQFAYNFRNQLVRAIDGGSTVTMKYDPLGRRIEKSGSGHTIRFYYAGNQVIEERNGSDSVTKQYVYGNGIDELFRLDVYSGATSTPYYIHTNDIGSTTAITDSTGALVERISYDTFGLPSFFNASGQPIAFSSIGNNILFQGREYEPELNLYNYRARYYDPIMGRFLQTDQIGYQDSMNLYQGLGMNPENNLDPLGEWATNVANVHAILIRHALVQRRFINLENAYYKGHYDQQFYDEINNKMKTAGSVNILMVLLGLTNKDVETIATEDKIFDNENQADEMQYVHSMRGNENETIAEAKQKRADFKIKTLNAIRNHRIIRKKSGDMRCWDEVELQLFAHLEHPFVDETCPTHNWKVFKKNLSVVPHTLGDLSPTSSDLFENAKIMWRLLIEASSEKEDLSDLPAVLVQMYNFLKKVSKQE